MLTRTIPIKLYAILIRIAQINGFADTMIGSTIKLYPSIEDTAQRHGKIGSCRMQNGQMKQARGMAWRRRRSLALPSIEPYVVMVTASGNEGCLLAKALCESESEHATIESQSSLDLRDLKMNVANAHAGRDRVRRMGSR